MPAPCGILRGAGTKRVFSGVLDWKSDASEKQPTRVRKLTLDRMIVRPVSLGGNAVIGVGCDYNHFAGNVTGISANGTAVRIGRLAGDDEDLNG